MVDVDVNLITSAPNRIVITVSIVVGDIEGAHVRSCGSIGNLMLDPACTVIMVLPPGDTVPVDFCGYIVRIRTNDIEIPIIIHIQHPQVFWAAYPA